MNSVQRARIVVTGKVQGVWFRQSTRDEGERLGLAGWVRNLPTGQVEALFEGEGSQVEALVAWCRRGPPLARVDQLDVSREPAQGGLPRPFAVRRAE